MCRNQTLEWLDAVCADLEPLRGVRIRFDGASVYGTTHTPEVESAVRSLLKHAPDRLDRMERALRGVMGLAEAWESQGPDVEQRGNIEQMCGASIVQTIQEALG